MPTLIIILIVITLLLIIIFSLLNSEHKTLDEQSRAELNADFISLKHGFVNYEIRGKANSPLVILVHGFSTPSYIWEPTFQALVKAGFKVLRFDLYGRGFSDRPKADYNLDLFVEQLADLVQALDIKDSFNLVGLSMGGPITAAYTNRYPKNVRSLTLIDPLVTNVFTSKAFPFNITGLGELIMAFYMAPFYLAKSQSGDFAQSEKYPDWPEKYKAQMKYKGFRRAILSTIRNLGKDDTLAEYRKLEKKGKRTLIFYGKEDKTIPPEDIAALRELISEHEYHAIDAAGHIPHYEQAEVVNPLLVKFLRSG